MIMQVSQIINDSAKSNGVDVSGWLVVIDGGLYLLDENLHSDYKRTVSIRLTDPSIMYVVRQSILPLGGGESFVFHEARVIGDLVRYPSPEILVKEIFIKEKGCPDMIKLDISEESIRIAKEKYEDAFSFDFFKEVDG